MEISELVWKLFILLLPGILSTLLIRYISTNKNYDPFYFLIYSAILGVGNYILLEIFYSFWNILQWIFISDFRVGFGFNLQIWNSIATIDSLSLDVGELIFSYLMSIPFGLLMAIVIQKKWIISFLKWLKLTRRFGDDDIWNFYLNSEDVEWVLVRDNTTKLTYFGRISSYSDSNEKRELVLEEVSVHETDTFNELYSSAFIYLELSGSFSIEAPVPIEISENVLNESNQISQNNVESALINEASEILQKHAVETNNNQREN